MTDILFEVKGGVATIILNRPEKFNAITGPMALRLQSILDECAKDVNTRSVYLTGNGRAFCAGQDLSEMSGDKAPGFDRILAEHYNPIVTRIRKLEKPVVAAINGVAAGAGANIALCCDIVVASENASFIQAFSKIGLIPDSGGTFTLPRLIGWQKASALMMLGEKVSATDAEKMGMIYKVFTQETFEENALLIAHYLAKMPTKGLAYTKLVLNNSVINCWEEQLQDEDIFQQRAAQTADYKEGVQAFLEKRQPNFKGE